MAIATDTGQTGATIAAIQGRPIVIGAATAIVTVAGQTITAAGTAAAGATTGVMTGTAIAATTAASSASAPIIRRIAVIAIAG